MNLQANWVKTQKKVFVILAFLLSHTFFCTHDYGWRLKGSNGGGGHTLQGRFLAVSQVRRTEYDLGLDHWCAHFWVEPSVRKMSTRDSLGDATFWAFPGLNTKLFSKS